MICNQEQNFVVECCVNINLCNIFNIIWNNNNWNRTSSIIIISRKCTSYHWRWKWLV